MCSTDECWTVLQRSSGQTQTVLKLEKGNEEAGRGRFTGL